MCRYCYRYCHGNFCYYSSLARPAYVYQMSLCPYGTSNVPFGPAPESILCGVAFESTSKPFSSPLDLQGDWLLSVFLDKVLITFKMMGVVTNY